MPELRIVGDRLWKKVKDRQRGIRKRYGKEYGNRLTAARRQRYLFSGLIKCGECGGGYSVIFRDILGCSTVKNKGTCSNTTRITRHELEARNASAPRDGAGIPQADRRTVRGLGRRTDPP